MAPHLANIHIPQFRVSDFDVLSDWDFDGVGRTFSAKVPGYRPTSTFLTTLRSNLQLSATGTSHSLPASAISTPTTTAFSPGTGYAQPPGPSPLSYSTLAYAVPAVMSSTTNDPPQADDIPDLTYEVAPTDSDERTEALKLVADSIAQQRQTASKAIILHPTALSGAIVVVAIMARYMELSSLIISAVGVLMAGMLAVRWYTAGYIFLAEEIGVRWLEDYGKYANNGNGNANGNGGSNNRDPVVMVAKWGDEVIGALVMRVVKRERKGYVQAWTVKLRYRNKGIGRGLLEEGAKIVWGKGGRGMAFEEEHANSGRVLPDFFNAQFKKDEVKARERLAEVVADTRKERSSR